jgi:hypothetical protein
MNLELISLEVNPILLAVITFPSLFEIPPIYREGDYGKGIL